MSLSAAIHTAQMSLSNTGIQTGTVSRNIANSSNPDYSRRSTLLTTSIVGAQVTTTLRTQDIALFRQSISGTASSSAQSALLKGLQELKDIFGGNDYETSPAVQIATLRDTLQAYAAKPNDLTLAQTAIADAMTLASGIQGAANAIQSIRFQTDQEIGREVDRLNSLLAQYQDANDAVYRGTQVNRDITAALDERDGLIKKISELVGIQTVQRAGNDIALYTDNGTTLFDRVPREVTFTTSGAFSATSTGSKIMIDGVELPAGTGSNTTANGSLAALLQVRDGYAPTLQIQLDEIARGLISVFRETDQSAVPTLPDLPGLFTWAGGNVPPDGVVEPGIAGSFAVNTALISSLGGNPQLLRDGGINGAAYVYNTTGGPGFSGRLDTIVQAFDTKRTFDSSTQLETNLSILELSGSSIGWLELNRSDADSAQETREAFRFRSVEAHSKATGVSLDEEMALLVELEQSYKAAARLITSVDQMLQSLLSAV